MSAHSATPHPLSLPIAGHQPQTGLHAPRSHCPQHWRLSSQSLAALTLRCAPKGQRPGVRCVAASMSPKLLTLVIPRRGGQLLLGRKLKGFGEGYWNGFGGKVEPGETIEGAAVRELHEEAGIVAKSMVQRGVLTFLWDEQPALPWEVHVFEVTEFTGSPVDTEEMAPAWFRPEEVPFDKMWQDDVYWYPLFLQGRSFRGTFRFKDTHTLVEHELQEVEAL